MDFNLSESGVQPLTLGELVEDTPRREALLDEALRYTQIERHRAAARGDRRDVSGSVARPRAGDQRRRPKRTSSPPGISSSRETKS